MKFGLKELIRNAASDGADGGGSGAGDDKSPVTLKAVQTLINESINGVVKRLEGEQKKTFGALDSKLTSLFDRLEKTGSQGGEDTGDGDGSGTSDQGGKKAGDTSKLPPDVKAQLDAQARQIANLNKKLESEASERAKANQKAEETERYAKIRSELGKYDILPEAIDDAFDLFKGRVARNEDGQLVVGDTTMEAHIKSALERNSGFLKPLDKAGAGSTSGQRVGGVDLNDIKAGMSKETEAAVSAQILRQLQANGQ
jgi:hypothetical protein